jgi:hypothetical protein
MSHNPTNFRQEPAQTNGVTHAPLVDCATSGSVLSVSGKIYPTPFTDQPIPATSLFGWAGVSCASLPGFFRTTLRKPLNRRGFAQTRIASEFFLRDRPDGRFVRLSVTNKKQGWAVCGQENSTPHWHFWRASRPAAKQPVNRHFMARGRACLGRSSSMAIRCWGPLRGPVATIFIARPIRGNAAKPLAGQYFSTNRFLRGSCRHAQSTVAGLLACGGALRSLIPNSPLYTSKDTPCSKRS